MTERVLAGVPASPGTAFGGVRRLDAAGEIDGTVLDDSLRPAAAARALEALTQSARELDELAGKLRAEGRTEEADILDAGAMMAEDPMLLESVENAVVSRGLTAASAILVEVETVARQLDTLGDPELGARPKTVGDAILVAPDLGPADVIELDSDVSGIALAVGGVTGHAAIVARGLGLPMVVGLGNDVLSLIEGEPCIVDADRSAVIASPDNARVDAVRRAIAAAREAHGRAMAARALPTVTRDGRVVRVLANGATPIEVRAALEAGADGIGLLRTELAFLEAM